MTAIAGFASKGKVTIGGDSAGIGGWDLTIRSDPKVFRVGECLVGGTSSFRMLQLLRFRFTPPKQRVDQDDFAYLCTDWIDAVRQCLKDGGYARKDREEEAGGCFLLGYRGKLYRIDPDYQVGIPSEGYAAVGCGEAYAIGALAVLKGSPESRVLRALAVAERFSAGVRGPFVVETI